jgi:TldD protein
VIGAIHEHHVDFADLYFQHARFESWSLEEGIVKAGSFNIDRGVGVRAVSGERQAFAYSDDITAAALDEARRGGARDRPPGPVGVRAARQARARAASLPRRRSGREPRRGVEGRLLERLEKMARARDPRVAQVMASLAGEQETVLIARSDGEIVADVRPLVRVSITVIVEENGRREQGHSAAAGASTTRTSTTALLGEYASAPSTRRCSTWRARRAGGPMTVVLGPGWPGILLHEAIGHGLEGDFNRKGTSAFAGASASASRRRASP